MKQDLDRVLRERGQLDYMREMLTSAVQAARQQQQQARAGDGGREHIHVGGPSNPPPRKGSPGRSGRGRNAGGQGRRESVRLVGGGTPGNWR